MQKSSVLYGIIGFLTGIIMTGFAAGQAVNNNYGGMMRMMGMDPHSHNQADANDHAAMSMDEMNQQLRNLSGDDFDKAFLAMMIAHHEGAVAMAELIPSRAKHQEIKTLGEAIMTAQAKEIEVMRQWRKDWGYDTGNMIHGAH